MKRLIKGLLLIIFIAGFVLLPAKPAHAMTGAGTAVDPYIIYDATDLQNVNLDITAYYELNNDIDCSETATWNAGAGFLPIATGGAFTGHFDGKGYSITDLYIYRPNTDGIALFYYLHTGSTLTDTHLVNPQIFGREYTAGMISDAANTTITNCSVVGGAIVARDVANTHYSGGFVANAGTGVVISSCYTYTNVYAKGNNSNWTQIGGFAGSASSTASITDCYSRTNLFGVDNSNSGWDLSPDPVAGNRQGLAAGFIARVANTAVVEDCYAAGIVTANQFKESLGVEQRYSFAYTKDAGASINTSFYDYQVGTATLDEGSATSQTTAQMKTESTFTNAGWDFVATWTIDTFNDGYPRLTAMALVGLVIQFNPIAIIVGTTLPDRSGEGNDGTFSWGANPGGVTASLGSLISPYQPGLVTPEETTRDVLGDIGVSDWFVEPDVAGALATNPFRPLVTMVSDNTNLTELQVWRWYGLIFVIFVTVSAAAVVPRHLVIACFAGGVATVTMVVMTIWPIWALTFLILYAIGGWVSERSPSL